MIMVINYSIHDYSILVKINYSNITKYFVY